MTMTTDIYELITIALDGSATVVLVVCMSYSIILTLRDMFRL
jgi:hypothetical protein